MPADSLIFTSYTTQSHKPRRRGVRSFMQVIASSRVSVVFQVSSDPFAYRHITLYSSRCRSNACSGSISSLFLGQNLKQTKGQQQVTGRRTAKSLKDQARPD